MLRAQGLSCQRGERTLFTGLELHVKAGEWLHIRGENGVGKTSLLRILAGLSQASEGEILWGEQSIHKDCESYHQNLLFLGHKEAVKEDLTAYENLQLSAVLDHIDLREEEAFMALSRFGLRGREDLPVRFLSAGQKRRVLLARLLTRKAKLWILDEPFNALDVKAVEMLSGLITEHVGNGGMVIMTSHQTISVPHGKVLEL